MEELRSGDRLDLAAKGIERVTVNASEKTALAPCGLAVEAGAEDRAFMLRVPSAGR